MMEPPVKPYDAVLFDLDGTLLDTARDFVVIVNILRRRHGLAHLPETTIRNEVSNGAAALVRLAFDMDDQHPEFSAILQELLDLYRDNLTTHTRPFEGIAELLLTIQRQGMVWGVVTNKPRHYTVPILEQLDLSKDCGTVVCPEDVNHRKPHPEPLLRACQEIDCNPARTLYVGDHERDIAAGRNAGMPTIAAHWGYINDPDEIATWNADFGFQTVSQVTHWLIKVTRTIPDRS